MHKTMNPQQQQQQQQQNQQQQHPDTKWFYCGPDNEKYGPYMSKDMLFWVQAGYFNNDLLVRTENEQEFRPLGDWHQLLGTYPFNTNVHSFEATANQLNASRPPPPQMMIMPPGLQQQYPPQMPLRLPPFLPMTLFHQMNNGQMVPQMHSQPPSEPIDAGSLSHTPDSDRETRLSEQSAQPHPAWQVALGLAGHRKSLQQSQLIHQHHQQQNGQHMMQQQPVVPRFTDAHTATEPVVMKNAECQTDPLKLELTKSNASRLLSELFGQIVVIN